MREKYFVLFGWRYHNKMLLSYDLSTGATDINKWNKISETKQNVLLNFRIHRHGNITSYLNLLINILLLLFAFICRCVHPVCLCVRCVCLLNFIFNLFVSGPNFWATTNVETFTCIFCLYLLSSDGVFVIYTAIKYICDCCFCGTNQKR